MLAYNRGEVSALALARVDLAKLQLAADCQLNWEPRVIGAMSLRRGLSYVGGVRSDLATRLLPFIFSRYDTALVELTSSAMRIWVDDALVTRPAVGTTVQNGDFSTLLGWSLVATDGCVSIITSNSLQLHAQAAGGRAYGATFVGVSPGDRGVRHALRITVVKGPVDLLIGYSLDQDDLLGRVSLGTGTHSIAFTPTTNFYLQFETRGTNTKVISGAQIEAAGPMTVPTTWDAADLPDLRIDQSGDVIFVTCAGRQSAKKIERRAIDSWSVATFLSDDGPLQSAPALTNCWLLPGAYYGDTVLTSQWPQFTTDHVGGLIRLFSPGQARSRLLGGGDQYTTPVRISGVGTDRGFGFTFGGTWTGTLTLQRSVDGPDSGFIDQSTYTVNGSVSLSDSPALDNQIVWYRVGFKSGAYVSGAVGVTAIYSGGGDYGVCRIVGLVSSQQVSIEILQDFSSIIATQDWVFSDWQGIDGYPTSVSFHEGRLWWFGGDKIWSSRSSNYTSYARQDTDGTPIGDSGAIMEQFGQGPVDIVSWGLSLSRLLCGRDMQISSIRSSSFDEPLTPTNFSVKDCATQGASRLPPLKVDKRGIFVEQSGRRVYELVFDSQAFDYSAHDLTRLNIDIGKKEFVDLAIARQPDTVCYFVRGDGQCAALLYEPDDDVVGWYRIQTLGSIENVCVLPSQEGLEDDVYFVVKRTINGSTKRFIEKLSRRLNCVGGSINEQLDCAVTYQGVAATTISLPHLPSTSVNIWADGVSLGAVTTNGAGLATLPNAVSATNIVAGLAGHISSYSGDPVAELTGLSAYEGLTAEVFADQQPSGHLSRLGPIIVSGGKITLPINRRASNIVAMFGYVAPFQSAKLAYGATQGTPLTMKKKIDHLGLILFDSHHQGVKYGQGFNLLDDLPQVERGDVVPDDTVWGEIDLPVTELGGSWDTDARLCLLAQAPLPCTLGAAVIAMKTNG